MKRAARTSQQGFTLIEVLLVLVVMALLAGAAVVRLASVFQDVTLDDAVRRVQELDRLARDRARSAGAAVEIVWVNDEHRGFYREQRDPERTERARTRLGECSIDVKSIAATAEPDADRAQARIVCSPAGYTRSYTVHVQARDGRELHLFVTGLTGEAKVLDDERAVQQLLAAASRATPTASDDAP